MARWSDVRRVAMALPEVVEEGGLGDSLAWRVGGKSFAWERPLRPKDIAELGALAPTGAVLGVHTPDLEAKDALIAEAPAVFFTTSHFNGYKAVLVRLDAIRVPMLREVLTDAWLARAPKKLAASFLSRP
jgi:hypothetical protein